MNVDDIPCVGASTFGRTEGLVGLEGRERTAGRGGLPEKGRRREAMTTTTTTTTMRMRMRRIERRPVG